MSERDDQYHSRYARQLSLPLIGPKGQERLARARVLLVGAGGLGSPASLYLAAAGVGALTVMDPDEVDLSNLQRQILYATCDVGRPKTEAAAARLRALNPLCTVEHRRERLDSGNARAHVAAHDFVIDATDDFASKFLIADTCHATGTPCCHAGIREFEGQVMTVIPGQTACYRCVFGGPPPDETAAPRGPLGVVPGIIGTIQAAEAIKWITGAGRLLAGRLLLCNVLGMNFRTVPLRRDDACTLCGTPPSTSSTQANERNTP